MRILTWNINSIKTIPQYHPWNSFKNLSGILDNLGANILCFQEMKITRQAITSDIAVPESFDAFISLPQKKSGYSGVAVYTRSPQCTPLHAEEGLTGLVQPKPPFAPPERVSRPDVYPSETLADNNSVDLKDLDCEGRALVVDFGLFVLINVYCPNDGTGTEERIKYKTDYHALLNERVRGLIQDEGREVIVVGDLNACAAVIDHVEGDIMVAKGRDEGLEGEQGFFGTYEARPWLRSWLRPDGGPLIDIVREKHPDRKGMYTCWNTKLSGRDNNYGTRIDYILITPGLERWVKGADIQPQIKGSDHCPVYLDLHDEITDDAGSVTRLQDIMTLGVEKLPCPRLAACFWDEFSGKQKRLDTFFGKKGDPAPPSLSQTSSTSRTPVPSTPSQSSTQPSSSQPETSQTPSRSQASSSPPRPASSSQGKRKISADVSSSSGKVKKQKSQPIKGQSSLQSFFSKPNPARDAKGKAKAEITEADPPDSDPFLLYEDEVSNTTPASSQAWKSLMAPIQPPKCTIHGEVAKELTTKQGPNKGKNFFICSRPIGPGYDKGKTERRREDVDYQWRCNYFKWSSDVRREANIRK